MEEINADSVETQVPVDLEGKSKYSDYVSPDGRPWDKLTVEEKAKARKKLKKKLQAKELKAITTEMVTSLVEKPEKESEPSITQEPEAKVSVEAQVLWCTA